MTSLQRANLLIRNSFTHVHSPVAQPLGAIWGSVSCLRTLRHEDWRKRGSNHQPSDLKLFTTKTVNVLRIRHLHQLRPYNVMWKIASFKLPLPMPVASWLTPSSRWYITAVQLKTAVQPAVSPFTRCMPQPVRPSYGEQAHCSGTVLHHDTEPPRGRKPYLCEYSQPNVRRAWSAPCYRTFHTMHGDDL